MELRLYPIYTDSVCFIDWHISFFSLFFPSYFLVLKFFGETQTGWTSLITSIWLIGGLQLIAIGLIGGYVGKIYKNQSEDPSILLILTYSICLFHNLSESMKQSIKTF